MTKINQSFENEYFMRDFFSVFVAKETYLYSGGKSPSHKIGFIPQKNSDGTTQRHLIAYNDLKISFPDFRYLYLHLGYLVLVFGRCFLLWICAP